MDIALHPKFADNKLIYFTYNKPASAVYFSLARYTRSQTRAGHVYNALTGVPVRKATVTLNAPQMLTTPVYYPNAVTEVTATRVEVIAGKESRGIDVRLFRIPQPRFFSCARTRGWGSLRCSGSGVPGFPVGPPDYAFDMEVPAGEQTLSANTPNEP